MKWKSLSTLFSDFKSVSHTYLCVTTFFGLLLICQTGTGTGLWRTCVTLPLTVILQSGVSSYHIAVCRAVNLGGDPVSGNIKTLLKTLCTTQPQSCLSKYTLEQKQTTASVWVALKPTWYEPTTWYSGHALWWQKSGACQLLQDHTMARTTSKDRKCSILLDCRLIPHTCCTWWVLSELQVDQVTHKRPHCSSSTKEREEFPLSVTTANTFTHRSSQKKTIHHKKQRYVWYACMFCDMKRTSVQWAQLWGHWRRGALKRTQPGERGDL